MLNSCSPSPQKSPEGNIDVDSEIYIIPIGDDVDESLLHAMVPRLEKRFTTKVHVALDRRMPSPEHAYDFEAKKFVALYILSDLIKLDVPENVKVLGVINVDIFVPESDRPFIFGQAHFGKNPKAALISKLRMDPSSYEGGRPDNKLLVQRMLKEAVHELGHVFGLINCGEIECAMYLPKDLKELDKKTDNFCLKEQKSFRVLQQKKTEDASSQDVP